MPGWLAGRDERALRETIGYGVLAGLTVSATDPTAKDDATIQVQPGLALAPDGKLVAVPTRQCASLKGWLKGAGKKTSNAKEQVTAYVLLTFEETLGTPVPIPGEPCRAESAQQADSRWSENFRLSLSWHAPGHTEEAALRRFAAWLRAIPVYTGSKMDGVTLEHFPEAIKKIIGAKLQAGEDPPATLPRTEDGEVLALPRAQYREYIATAFRVWAQELRLQYLAPHRPVHRSNADTETERKEQALTLAAIDFALCRGVLEGNSKVAVRAQDTPLLLQLRMLQEWLISAPEDDAPFDASYVLGRGDERLPNAQDLLRDFFPDPPESGTLTPGPIARVDLVSNDDNRAARITPAAKYAGDPVADYFGPGMEAPIPVIDGGTGWNCLPSDGQLLLGCGDHFQPGDLVAGSGENPSLSITPIKDEDPRLEIDTIQPLHRAADPTFSSLTLNGTNTSPPQPALNVTGSAVMDELVLTKMGRALLATNDQDQVVKAKLWDGELPQGASENTAAPLHYYGPGQSAPVRIEDGGTGLNVLPAPLQLLIGRDDSPQQGYVLAKLEAGPNASIALTHIDTPPLAATQSQRIYTLSIGAPGGGGMNVVPATGGSVTVATAGTTATLDTVQPLGTGAAPTFGALSLAQPNQTDDPSHRLGWNDKTQRVVASNAPARSRLRLVFRSIESEVLPTDEVLVFRNDTRLTIQLPDTALIDGRVLVIKAMAGASSGVNVPNTEIGDLTLYGGDAVTLVASRDLGRWLLLSRMTLGLV
jgi:hypothetical protein